MALGTQSVYNAVSATAAVAAGNNFIAINIAAQTWTGFTLQGKVVNTAAASKTGEKLIIYCTQSSLNSTSETIAQVKPASANWIISMPGEASATQYFSIPPQVRTGDFLYIWIDHEGWDAARTMTINVVQATP